MRSAKRDENIDRTGEDVVTLVDNILSTAIESGASDVHFEPTASELLIKYRLDGVLTDVDRLPKIISENIIARLKVLGGLLTYRNDIPQEGRIESKNRTSNIRDQRLAVFPTINGQRAVVRLFYQHGDLVDLEQLGFSNDMQRALQQIATSSQGFLLLTGPAGSGKSTTLAALLRYILNECGGKSIVSLEDPVEIRIDGVTQIQISPYGDMTFPTALRSLLRQDPQVLMIGEIRDAETAKIAIESSLTGHFLMSTMHSGTPAAGFLRLLEMGIEPYQITSSVTAILNQRLVRRLCPKCKTRNKKTGLFEPVGCSDCLKTGFKGRLLICEIAEMTSQLRKVITAKGDIEQFKEAIKHQNQTDMVEDGLRFVEQGLTTKDELKKVIHLNDRVDIN